MKIQLERRLASCPETLQCTVCHRPFAVGIIRPLLYSDRGWLKGDVCPHCLQLSPNLFKQILWTQAMCLMDPTSTGQSPTLLRHQESLECLQLAQENLRRPTWLHWWLKHIEIFSQEAKELEAAQLGPAPGSDQQRLRLEKLLG